MEAATLFETRYPELAQGSSNHILFVKVRPKPNLIQGWMKQTAVFIAETCSNVFLIYHNCLSYTFKDDKEEWLQYLSNAYYVPRIELSLGMRRTFYSHRPVENAVAERGYKMCSRSSRK